MRIRVVACGWGKGSQVCTYAWARQLCTLHRSAECARACLPQVCRACASTRCAPSCLRPVCLRSVPPPNRAPCVPPPSHASLRASTGVPKHALPQLCRACLCPGVPCTGSLACPAALCCLSGRRGLAAALSQTGASTIFSSPSESLSYSGPSALVYGFRVSLSVSTPKGCLCRGTRIRTQGGPLAACLCPEEVEEHMMSMKAVTENFQRDSNCPEHTHSCAKSAFGTQSRLVHRRVMAGRD